MKGSYLDTTVVVHIAEGPEEQRKKSKAFVKANQPSEMPYYALRELLAGRVQVICEAHNAILASENHGEALLALLNRSPFEGRKKEARIKIIAESLERAFNAEPEGKREHLKRELLEDISLKAARLWLNARKLHSVEKVQSLGCFNDGKLIYGSRGELRGPNDSFNCIKTERCAAAAYIYDNKSILKTMIDALHPNNIDPKLATKREIQQRRRALKELQSKGPRSFHKGRCRALGDAYFAAMCPPGSVIATSNLVDFIPLCEAIKKEVQEP